MPQAPLSSDGGPSEGRRSIDSTDESGPGAGSAAPGARHLKGPSQMRDQRTNSGVPGRPTSKRCSACRVIRPTDEFYADRRGRLTGRCRDCHRQQTRANNRRRHAALRLLITAHMEEYQALLAAQRPRHEADSKSIRGGGADAA